MNAERPAPPSEAAEPAQPCTDFDPRLCRTDTFTDRDVVLTRCLEARSCPHKRRYLQMSLCACPLSG